MKLMYEKYANVVQRCMQLEQKYRTLLESTSPRAPPVSIDVIANANRSTNASQKHESFSDDSFRGHHSHEKDRDSRTARMFV